MRVPEVHGAPEHRLVSAPDALVHASHVAVRQILRVKAGGQRPLRPRLDAKDLSYRDVRCVDEGVRRGGDAVFRCNVNFGEPHIEGYCVVLREGRAITQVEDRALRCRRTRTGDEP